MNLGFDLDGTFINYPPFVPGWLIDWLFKDHTKKNLAYRFPGKLEQQIRRVSHMPWFRPPMRGNIAFVQRLAKQKRHTLSLISGRFSFLEDITSFILKKYGLTHLFERMEFDYSDKQPHLFKNKVVKKLSLDRYVDDDLPLLEFLCQENPKTKFFWLNKRLTKSLEKNLWAITKLSDILK